MRQKRSLSDLMTVEQVADYLRLNKLTVYRYIRTGDLPAVRIGRALRVLRADVDGFLEARRVRTASRPKATPSGVERKPAEVPTQARTPVVVDYAEPIDVLEERRRRQVLLSTNPLDWVIRGLH